MKPDADPLVLVDDRMPGRNLAEHRAFNTANGSVLVDLDGLPFCDVGVAYFSYSGEVEGPNLGAAVKPTDVYFT